jgi:DNA-binding LacI/PurR family transcriptional regulator
MNKRVRSKATYLQVEADLRARLTQNYYSPGAMLPGRRELASEFGVAIGTIERALDNLIADGLLSAHPGRGTFVGDAVKKPKTGFIGFVGHGYASAQRNPYWGNVIAGLQDVAHREEKHLVLLNENSPHGWNEVDGILVTDSKHDKQIKLLKNKIPSVSLLVTIPGISGVVADDYQGGRDIVEYLFAQGHKRIACLHVQGNVITERRYAGYCAAYLHAGLELHRSWVRFMDFDAEHPNFEGPGYKCMQSWLADNWHETGCTAILASNDETAMGIIKALVESGLRVPEDVSVVGFDGAGIVNQSIEDLTTVKVPLDEIGTHAMELLLRLMKQDDKLISTIAFPTQLVISKSTGKPPLSE